ncbi:MAG: O-antigen ligase family protein [Martelella sp.]|uniref:O-antigen ligase family protein n=1 Tax=Martelella sp. TaxID=1969699 RepID=UPI003242B38A
MTRAGLRFRLDGFWRLAVLVIVLRAISGETSLLAYFLVTVYGIRGPRQAIEALMLSWFITMANPGIFGPVTGGSIGRFLLLFAISASVLFRGSKRVSHVVVATILLGGYAIVHSVLFSPVLLVSVLKGVTWTLAMLSITLSFSKLSRDQFHLFRKHAYGFLALITFLCIPIYLLFPAGQMFGYGFLRGMLGHSQATGALAALMAAWAFGRILDRPQRTVADFAVFGVSFVTAFMSGTRTAVVAIVAALIAVLFLAAIRNRHPLRQLLRKMSTPVVALGVMAVLLVAVTNSGTILNSFSSFLSKSSGAINLTDAYETSRGALIGKMFQNISNDPIIGIGFGIASDPETMEVERIAGIPVSAVVEKGVAHIAIWEELGIIGLLLYVYWAVVVFSKAFRADAASVSILATIFLLNFGDAYIFSAGGMGLLLMVLIGFASYASNRKPLLSHRQASAPGAPGPSLEWR